MQSSKALAPVLFQELLQLDHDGVGDISIVFKKVVIVDPSNQAEIEDSHVGHRRNSNSIHAKHQLDELSFSLTRVHQPSGVRCLQVLGLEAERLTTWMSSACVTGPAHLEALVEKPRALKVHCMIQHNPLVSVTHQKLSQGKMICSKRLLLKTSEKEQFGSSNRCS